MTETSEPPVLDLLEDVLPDDGFRAFFRREFGPARRVVEVIVGDRLRAQTITLEAFAAALRRWDKVRGQGAPAAWVRRRAVRQAVTALPPSEPPGQLLDAPGGVDQPDRPGAEVAPLPDLDLATLDRLEVEVRQRAARVARQRRRSAMAAAVAVLVVVGLVAALSTWSTRRPSSTSAAPAPPTTTAPLPGGQLLVADQDGALDLRSARTGAEQRQVVPPRGLHTVTSLSTPADGRSAYVSWIESDPVAPTGPPVASGLYQMSLVTVGATPRPIHPPVAAAPGTPLAVSPDGRQLAYVPAGVQARFEVAVLDLATGRAARWAKSGLAAPAATTGRTLQFGPADIVSETVTWLSWSPDDRHLAVSYDTAIDGADPAARSIEILDTRHPASATNPRPLDPEAPYDRTISFDAVYQGPDRVTSLYGCPSVDYCPMTSPVLSSVDPTSGRTLVPPASDGDDAGAIVSNLAPGPGLVIYTTELDCTSCATGASWEIDVLDAGGARTIVSGTQAGLAALEEPTLVVWLP